MIYSGPHTRRTYLGGVPREQNSHLSQHVPLYEDVSPSTLVYEGMSSNILVYEESYITKCTGMRGVIHHQVYWYTRSPMSPSSLVCENKRTPAGVRGGATVPGCSREAFPESYIIKYACIQRSAPKSYITKYTGHISPNHTSIRQSAPRSYVTQT